MPLEPTPRNGARVDNVGLHQLTIKLTRIQRRVVRWSSGEGRHRCRRGAPAIGGVASPWIGILASAWAHRALIIDTLSKAINEAT